MLKDSRNKSETKHSSLALSSAPRKLTTRDTALGLGRKATNEELEEYLSRPYGKSIPLKQAIAQIKEKLLQKQIKANY